VEFVQSQERVYGAGTPYPQGTRNRGTIQHGLLLCEIRDTHRGSAKLDS
jgi:hypothetical protein